MKRLSVVIAMAAASFAGEAMSQNTVDLSDAPRLRAGYWETTSVTHSDDGSETTKISLCVDDALQEEMNLFSSGSQIGACSEMSLTQHGSDRWSFRSVCNPGNMGQMLTEGMISGDMQTQYQSEIITSGSRMGQAVKEKTVQKARYVGVCPAGIVPGDMLMEGGMKINMKQMAELSRGMSGLSGSGGASSGQSPATQPLPSTGLPPDAAQLIESLREKSRQMSGN